MGLFNILFVVVLCNFSERYLSSAMKTRDHKKKKNKKIALRFYNRQLHDFNALFLL